MGKYHGGSPAATTFLKSESAPIWGGCNVTITRAVDGLKLRKRWRTDGEKADPDGTFPTWYRSEVYHVADLEALRDTLCHLSKAPDIALVMGTPKHSDGMRHRKNNANYTDNGSTLLCLDFDGEGWPDDPERLRDTLSEPLRGAAAVVQRSSSHGWKGQNRYRLFFPLSASMTLPQMRAIAADCSADLCIYSASHLLYTADPIGADGAPVWIDCERFSLLSGAPVVDIELLKAAVLQRSAPALAESLSAKKRTRERAATVNQDNTPTGLVPEYWLRFYSHIDRVIDGQIAQYLARGRIGQKVPEGYRHHLLFNKCVCLSWTESDREKRIQLARGFALKWLSNPDDFTDLAPVQNALHGRNGQRLTLKPHVIADLFRLPNHIRMSLMTIVYSKDKGTGKELREAKTARIEAENTEALRMLAEGKTIVTAANELGIIPDTLQKRLKRIQKQRTLPLLETSEAKSLHDQALSLSNVVPLSSSDSEHDSEKCGRTSTVTPTPGALLSAFLLLNGILIPHPDILPWGTAPRSTDRPPSLQFSPSEARKLLNYTACSPPLDDGFCYCVATA